MKTVAWSIVLSLIVTLSSFAAPLSVTAEKIFYTKCSGCHGTQIITKKIKSKSEWKKTVKRMKRYGLKTSRSERNEILKYLYRYHSK